MARPGPSWSRLEREQERELVHHVAGLRDEADPNFQLSLHFAWSNCRFHRFLDVNSHKVEKTIEGIYEKFIVHSDLNKAASWKRLTEEFLNASLPSTKEVKTDAHYSILSLLCLSDSTSNNNYVETPREKEVEEKDDFDWGRYLMEGEEINLSPDVDTPNWSEDSEDEDDQQPLSREDSGIQVDRTPLEEQNQNRKPGSHILWKAEPSHSLTAAQLGLGIELLLLRTLERAHEIVFLIFLSDSSLLMYRNAVEGQLSGSVG